MLRIAVQSKGRLFEETMALLQEAEIKISSSKNFIGTIIQFPHRGAFSS